MTSDSVSNRNVIIKRLCSCSQGAALAVLTNPLLQIPVAIVLLVPLIATIGQYVHTGFMLESHSLALLFWPGVDGSVAPSIPVWLAMGAMLTSYAAGIVYLAHRRDLCVVASLGLITALVSIGLAGIINSFTGWHEAQDIGDMTCPPKTEPASMLDW
jgi:hypothetical protein